MLNWKLFVENKLEKEEEKTGLDLDHDREKGESSTHKKKIEAKKKENLEFFEKRRLGGQNIAQQAQTKGGPSILTFWHFKAKDRPYREVIQAIKSDKNEQFYLSKCRELASQLRYGKMSQKQFQEVMGRLETFGEALAKLF